ncbi:hypothetical protein [Streptomyces rubradiris]|uniref:hypothetical protein n=1 Tax=Streptomyces rubradiris TaxID=285531 RepID=UPI00167A51D1|nr:hypothetical protein [Streptomyces rubradiris]GHH25624.1 hypothetical protein GCM10018792_64830 [Streptomyces rubradiris]
MRQFTRPDTVNRQLVNGGFTDLAIPWDRQEKDQPTLYRVDGFSTRPYRTSDGTLLAVAGAYGPNWLATLAEMNNWLQQPQAGYTVIGDVPGLGEHEVLVRWATSDELQPRRAAAAERRAALRAQERRTQARRQAEEAGQASLF